MLPAVLILLFGYGLSFDVKNAPVAVVLEDSSPSAREVLAGLEDRPIWRPCGRPAWWRPSAGCATGKCAIVRAGGLLAQIGSGASPGAVAAERCRFNTAAAVDGYVGGAIATWAQQKADRAGSKAGAGGVELVQRMWFNEASTSTWYLVPGLIALVMTLIGAFLTSLLIAREWERGTLESLFVTPVRPLEIVLAKLAPYLLVGAVDLALCLLAAKFLFHVPMRGSLRVIVLASCCT